MSLKDEISGIIGNRKKFVLLRVADVDAITARKLCGIGLGTYNSWFRDERFTTIYRKVRDLTSEYRQEAIQLLRRDNQLQAVLLEGRIIDKLVEELDSGDYQLMKTNLAREVYGKLIVALDVVPQTQIISWEQRLQQIITVPSPEQLEQPIEGEFRDANLEANSQSETESPESPHESKGQQAPTQDEQDAQKEGILVDAPPKVNE